MSIYDNHSETPGKRAVSVTRCIIAVLDVANALLLGITLALYYAWMPRPTEDKIPIDWTDPLVIVAVSPLPSLQLPSDSALLPSSTLTLPHRSALHSPTHRIRPY